MINQKEENCLRINLPAGGHDAVLLGDLLPMMLAWSKVIVEFDTMIMRQYGEAAGRSLVDVVPTLAYAHVSKAVWALCGVADIRSGDFDPVEFGKRCEAIARAQIQRHHAAKESGR